MNIFIYALQDPDTLQIRYIGATNDLEIRFNTHINGPGSKQKVEWIRSLIQQNKQPKLVVLETTNELLAKQREEFWNKKYKSEFLLSDIDNYYNKKFNQKQIEETLLVESIQLWFQANKNEISTNKRFWKKNPVGKVIQQIMKEQNRWKNAPRGAKFKKFPTKTANSEPEPDFDF